MADDKVYTSSQSINKLLGDIFTTFPTVYNSSSENVTLDIVVPIYNRSKSFCEMMKKMKLRMSLAEEGGYGEVGPFYILNKIDKYKKRQDKIFISGISFRRNGGWRSYFMEIWGKKTHGTLGTPRLKIKTKNENGLIMYVSSDLLHESIIGSLMSHIFDMGYSPSVLKYAGLYICDVNSSNPEKLNGKNKRFIPSEMNRDEDVTLRGQPTIAFEKSDVDFLSILGDIIDEGPGYQYEELYKKITCSDIITWLIQLAHTFYTMKAHFGISHYDAHLKNIMFTYVKETDKLYWVEYKEDGGREKKRDVTKIMYNGKYLDEIEYYIYILPFKLSAGSEKYSTAIVMKNNGFLPKLIDYGLTYSSFQDSKFNKDINIGFSNEEITRDDIAGLKDALESPNKGDLEYNYLIANLMTQLYRNKTMEGMAYYEDEDLIKKTEELIVKRRRGGVTKLIEFVKETFGLGSDAIDKLMEDDEYGPTVKISGQDIPIWKLKDNEDVWSMPIRNVGTTSDIKGPLKRILKYLMNDNFENYSTMEHIKGELFAIYSHDTDVRNSMWRILNDKKYIIIGGESKSSNKDYSTVNKFINASKEYWNTCISNGGILNDEDLKEYLKKNNLPQDWNKDRLCSELNKDGNKLNPSSMLNVDFYDNLVLNNSDLIIKKNTGERSQKYKEREEIRKKEEEEEKNREQKRREEREKIKEKLKEMEIEENNDNKRKIERQAAREKESKMNVMEKNISTELLIKNNLLNLTLGNDDIQIFTVKLQPSLTELTNIYKKEKPAFNKEQRMLNFEPPPADLIDKLMKNINLRLIYIVQNNTTASIKVEKKDLFTVVDKELKNNEYGLAVNGGFFIVNGNINNSLTPNLRDKFMYPIGYFYNKDFTEYNGTTLPFPEAYRKDMAVIYTDEYNKIHLMKSSDFMSKHETKKIPVNYRVILPDDEIDEVFDIETIKMVNNEPIMKDVNFTYNSALESGPILIWNGDIIFNREKMNVSKFEVDIIHKNKSEIVPYTVSLSAENYKMYFNEPGESDFLYGQRSSNSLNVHNVICETFDNKLLFFFVEGRGFDALGLDRPQLAAMIHNFNVKNAVALDGGFSANAVFKTENDGNQWLLNDPDKRALSSVILIRNK